MDSRVPIAAGLGSGVLVAVLLIVGIIALGPDPGAARASSPPPPPSAGASPTAAGPSAAPPSTSASPNPSLGGDGAVGGIGPDIMAAGLRTIMPGADVTP
jgi:hypothetical protein